MRQNWTEYTFVARFTTLFVSAIAVLIMLGGCGGGNTDEAVGGNQPTTPLTPKGWELVWSDEFDGSSLDGSKWNYQIGDGTAYGIPGWGNNELQSYRSDNVEVANGNLIISAREESSPDGKAYTSGRINTSGKFDFRYGRVEASVHASGAQGLWSAFWMLPTNSPYGGWAAGGEIDIMEVFSRSPRPFTQAAIHFGMGWPLNTFEYKKFEGIDPADGFHVYVVEWDEQELRWFVDGTHYYTVGRSTYWNYFINSTTKAYEAGGSSAPFDQPFHLLLNLAVGGNLPGLPQAGSLPAEMRVDYVRVYECTVNRSSGVGCDGFKDFTDPSVIPPLPKDVFRAEYNLYVDSVGPVEFPGSQEILVLDIGVYDAGGALTISEVDGGGSRGMVIDVNTSGGGNFNIFPTNLERQTLFGMGSASDGANYAGELQFDLYIFGAETDGASGLQIKMDSGFPDVGFVELPVAELTKDAWTTVNVQISDIAHNPASFGGMPVDLGSILSLFVLEPTSSAHVQVDNIKLICGHIDADLCGIVPPSPPPPPSTEPQHVYIDGVDPTWDRGIGASDSGTGWTDYFNGATANKVTWQEISTTDRGQVLEVTFDDSASFGVWYIQAHMGRNLTAYASGTVSFDIKVDDYGANATGMTMKIDCMFPCTSGDQSIGKVGDGAWETVAVPVTQLLTGGLDLAAVNTGIVLFPTQQMNTQTFQLDNVQWLPAAGARPIVIYDESFREGWGTYDLHGGAIISEVHDGAVDGNVIELNYGVTSTIAGMQATDPIDSVDVSSISNGTFQFDFKQIAPPQSGSAWSFALDDSALATSVELLLTDAANPVPGPNWQSYSFSIKDNLADLDLTSVGRITMFPSPGDSHGAIARIDNVQFAPPSPSLVVYDDALADGWFLWDCCGAATFEEVDDDPAHGKVIQLTFGAGATVTGLQATAAVDVSAAKRGTLEFDFKEVAPPPMGSVWRVKLESSGAATFAEVVMTAGGNPTPNSTWQSYSYELDLELAALDLSELTLILFFPDWGIAEGAIGRIDNVRMVAL